MGSRSAPILQRARPSRSNQRIGAEVRQTMQREATSPENLPVEPPIAEVRKRLAAYRPLTIVEKPIDPAIGSYETCARIIAEGRFLDMSCCARLLLFSDGTDLGSPKTWAHPRERHAGMLLRRSSSCGHDRQAALEVVGDGGEPNLNRGFGQPSPPHPAQTVASFPGAKDLLDPTSYPMNGTIPGMEACQRLLFVASPHAGGDNARCAAPGANRIAEMAASIGTV